jgi:HAD superfamily hydrolase (TIGR01509 family)
MMGIPPRSPDFPGVSRIGGAFFVLSLWADLIKSSMIGQMLIFVDAMIILSLGCFIKQIKQARFNMATENNDGNVAGNRSGDTQSTDTIIRNLMTDCEAVLFDCDGVLVNSEPISLVTLVDVLDHFGAPLSLAEVSDRFTGRSSSAPIEYILEQTGQDVRSAFKPYYYELLFDRYDRDLMKIGGIDCVLTVLKQRQIAFCISSSSSVERLEKTMQVTGLGHWFERRIYSADFVKNGKPAPDLFLHAAADMGYAPAKTIVIEDSVAGVTAAVAAGMACIGFVGGGHYDGDRETAVKRLYDAGADIVLTNMPDLARAIAASS